MSSGDYTRGCLNPGTVGSGYGDTTYHGLKPDQRNTTGTRQMRTYSGTPKLTFNGTGNLRQANPLYQTTRGNAFGDTTPLSSKPSTGRYGNSLDVTVHVRNYTGRHEAAPAMAPAGIRLPLGQSGQYRPRESTNPVFHTTQTAATGKPLFQSTTGNAFGIDTPLNRTNAPGKTVQGSIPAAYERPEVDKCGHQRTSGNMTTHVRKHELKQRWPAWFPDSGSGFCNNYRPHLLPLRPAPKSADPKGLHPIIAAKWHKKDPVDFMATMRPRAETTNQTMAMFGQFKKDYGYQRHLGMDSQRCSTAPVKGTSLTGL